MKQRLSLFLVMCMVMGLFPTVALASDTQVFADVPAESWYYDAITYVYEHDMMSGTGNNQFSPTALTTRGMIVTILHRMEGTPEAADAAFSDVQQGTYCQAAINWASACNIVGGYGDGNFGPNNLISREQMATILYHYAQYKGYDTTVSGDLNVFSDQASVGDYAKNALCWAVGAGLISGYTDQTLDPRGYTSRGEVAVILNRFCALFAEDSGKSQTYTVSFDVNYDDKGIDTQKTVPAGDTVEKPSTPTRSGHSFAGWYKDESLATSFDFDTKIFSDVTLYAKWIPFSGSSGQSDGHDEQASFTVSFYESQDDATPFETVDVKSGDCVQSAVLPVRTDEIFIGWYTTPNESDWSNAFIFETTPITKDISLYAICLENVDTDGDGLIDALEYYIGTDVALTDTDGDGLDDYYDFAVFNYDPLLADTDLDSIDDSAEDYDGDNLSNAQELVRGTDPLFFDTDGDTLSDYDELTTHSTNPLLQDTDGDDVNDDVELALGTDPLNYNTTFTVEQSTPAPSELYPVSATVTTQVKGAQVESLTVQSSANGALNAIIPGYLGEAIDIAIDGDIDSATLEFYYDSSLGQINDTFQPRIYYYNEQLGYLEEVDDQVVEDGKVTATTTHFSSYILLNKVDFDKVWDSEIKSPLITDDGDELALAIAFAIDSSGSMYDNDSTGLRKDLAKEFVDKLRDFDLGAVVDFDSDAILLSSFTDDKEEIKAAIDRVDSSGGTDIGAGVELALEQFAPYAQDEGTIKYIVLLTDGEGDYDSTLTQQAADSGIIIYTIGLGHYIDEELLITIAAETGGKYYYADNADELTDVFDEVAQETIDLTIDSNGDLIPDYYNDLIKAGKLRTGTGAFISPVDFNYDEDGNPSADYDGDGLLNGEELVLTTQNGYTYVNMKSHPMMVHSDADGLDDYMESIYGTNAFVNTYHYRGVEYALDNDNFTYERVLDNESAAYQKISNAIFSATQFNWSQDEEAMMLIADFLEAYADVSTMDDVSETIQREILYATCESMLGDINKLDNAADYWDLIKACCEILGNLNDAHVTLESCIEQFQIVANTFSKTMGNIPCVEIPSKLGVGEWLNIAAMSIESAGDMISVVDNYSQLIANKELYQESIELLEELSKNADNSYVKCAAREVKSVTENQLVTFLYAVDDAALAQLENLTELTSNLISLHPYIIISKMIVDQFADKAEQIVSSVYSLRTLDDIINGTKALFNVEEPNDGGYYFEITDTKQLQYITQLIFARICAGEYANVIVSNQTYVEDWLFVSLFVDFDKQDVLNQITNENDTLEEYLEWYLA